MQPAEEWNDLVTDEAALGVGVRGVDTVREAVLVAVGDGLLAPDLEERPDHTVLALRLDRPGRARGDEPVEHRLDLIRRRVAGRPQPAILRHAIPDLPQVRLGRAS